MAEVGGRGICLSVLVCRLFVLLGKSENQTKIVLGYSEVVIQKVENFLENGPGMTKIIIYKQKMLRWAISEK